MKAPLIVRDQRPRWYLIALALAHLVDAIIGLVAWPFLYRGRVEGELVIRVYNRDRDEIERWVTASTHIWQYPG
jgi:hypothetical protein